MQSSRAPSGPRGGRGRGRGRGGSGGQGSGGYGGNRNASGSGGFNRQDDRRERSRSPYRTNRDRDRSPYRGGRNRDRSRSPFRRSEQRGRSPPRGPRSSNNSNSNNNNNNNNNNNRQDHRPAAQVVQAPLPDENLEPEEYMRRVMGFNGFRSTKNTKVPGNDKNYAVRVDKETRYRQYMNRTKGFNRPLSPVRGRRKGETT